MTNYRNIQNIFGDPLNMNEHIELKSKTNALTVILIITSAALLIHLTHLYINSQNKNYKIVSSKK